MNLVQQQPHQKNQHPDKNQMFKHPNQHNYKNYQQYLQYIKTKDQYQQLIHIIVLITIKKHK